MQSLRYMTALIFVALAIAPAAAKDAIELKNAKRESVGTATLYNGMHGLKVILNLKNLPPGEHAVHIHAKPLCEADAEKPTEAFKSAGPHFNPENKKHGFKNPDAPHAGDLPNFTVGPDGTAKVDFDAPHATLFDSLYKGRNGLWENGGAAIVVHAKPDDMTTDPAGNAGDRIACGVIARPKDYKPQK
jgi:superoxide dismutase, Cu-Zn family